MAIAPARGPASPCLPHRGEHAVAPVRAPRGPGRTRPRSRRAGTPRTHAARRRSPRRVRAGRDGPGTGGNRRSARCRPGAGGRSAVLRPPPCPSVPRYRASVPRYCATVARATAGQANRSPTRRRARSASAARSAGESCSLLSTPASSSLSAGVTKAAASPVTSGSAPARLATSGVPEAMCSTAGSENPSYSEGTTATSALASRAENACSSSPWVNVTRSARDSWAASRSVAGAGWPTMIRCTSRSVISLATACSSVATPLIATSALATAMIRPRTRAACRGRNTRVSTPSGSAHPIRRDLEVAADVPPGRARHGDQRPGPGDLARHPGLHPDEPVPAAPDSRPSGPRSARSMRLSTLIGWWMLATSGSPSRRRPSSP